MNNNKPQRDMAGEAFSWIVIMIMLAAFWPVGVFMLIGKLKQYASTQPGVRQASEAEPPAVKQNAQNQERYDKPVRKNKKQKSSIEKKSGRFLSTMLLLCSIVLFIVGGSTLLDAVRALIGSGTASVLDFATGAFYMAGGAITLITRNLGLRKISRYKQYSAIVGNRLIVPIADIVSATGASEKSIIRDLHAMIDAGYLGDSAYIDNGLNALAISADAAADLRAKLTESDRAKQEHTSSGPYMDTILELRSLNETIFDIPISDKIDRIEMLTAKIFREVEDNPEKLPQIRRFMNYYLPTTLKLLHSYAVLEKQNIKGENISTAKDNINRILDKLATGYEQQLDMLFQNDAIDISADINVLEKMMRQDGLSDDGGFQTMQSQ